MENIGLPLEYDFGQETGPDVGQFEAAFELAQMDTFVSGWARNSALDDLGGKVLPPEELNEKYPFVQKKFTKPMSETAAFLLNEEGMKRMALQEKISQGAGNSLYAQATSLGAGIVAHMLDPVEFGVGAFTGYGLSAIGARVAGTTGYTALQKVGSALAGEGSNLARFSAQAAEGIVGNIALEPFMYEQQNRAQLDYTVEDAFVSVVGGGIAAPTAMFGLRKTWGGLFNKSDAATGLAVKTAIGQTQEGFRPNVDLVAKAHDDFIFKEPPKGTKLGEVRSEYRFEPLDPAKISERKFYVAGIPDDRRIVGEFFGEGTYATDNPNFANNLAAHPMEEYPVDVREITLPPEAKIIDGNLPNKEILDIAVASLPEGPLKKLLWNETSLPEAWQKIRHHIDLDLTDADAKLFLDTLGNRFDGIKLQDDIHGHNTLHVFPKAEHLISESSRFSPDKAALPKLDEVELSKVRDTLRSPENQLGFDEETWKQTKDFILDEELKLAEIESLKADTSDRIKQFKELADAGLLDAESKAEIERIQERQANIEQLNKAAEDFANCLATVGA